MTRVSTLPQFSLLQVINFYSTITKNCVYHSNNLSIGVTDSDWYSTITNEIYTDKKKNTIGLRSIVNQDMNEI